MPASKLKTYRGKRDFSRTPEPGGSGTAPVGNRFVVHKHWATADHYDLRLELNGVLKSWAVPKGPSLDPADKRFAAETEDHPVDYLDFEGVIPKGEYGGGPMIVWDTGTWAPMGDPEKDLARGSFKFRLAGDKLKGGWMLARLKKQAETDKQGWLLIKEHDPSADTETDILAARPESVKSGLLIEELEPSEPPSEPAPRPRKPAPLRPGREPGAVEAPMPDRLPAQLASPAAAPPTGKGWLHEIKLDGYRTMAHLGEGRAALITRSGLDWTHRFGDLPEAFMLLPCRQALVDGEIVVLDEKGVSHFAALQDALSQGAGDRLVFYAFDLLYLDGWDLTRVPLERRKALLQQLLAGAGANSAIQFSGHVTGDGRALYDKASELGLEGVVSKRATALYQPGRSKSWVKAKARKIEDFVIAGFTTSQAAEGLAALAMAEWVDGELHYLGKVGTGFDAAAAHMLLQRLEPLTQGAEPLQGAPRDIRWVRPVLSARVRYANRTADNQLRHAVFETLREAALSGSAGGERERLISDADLASIWVTNPTRKMFGRSGATKLDIAVYYAAIGDFMLPHLLDRPVSLVRCPTGRPQDCFFQRHIFTGMPPSVVGFTTQNSEDEDKTYLTIEDARGYLALAQFGVVEFHTWGTHKAHLEKPDRIVFDLDPGEGIAWREVVEGAVHVRAALEAMGLVPFVKTSGGKGLHVVVPIIPGPDWKQVHQTTGAIVEDIARGAPDTFTAVMGKDNRKRRIFVDFHRNARSATAAAPYSLRARAHLPASTPLNWQDLESIDAPDDLNYSTLPALVAASGDPWANIDRSARDLPKRSRKAR